jgi:aspartyl-tRNA(Asn)/glutamyl-tRNA(Gln) amidotransferase subunit B
MEEGSIRCDCNVSIRLKGTEPYGKRCEIKNMNSMRFAKRAIEFETKRQIELLENGGKVEQQTLNFDPVSGTTSPLREKEYAHDYRYFPEPDLPPIKLSEAYIDQIRREMPPLPWALKKELENHYQLSPYQAELLSEEKDKGLFFLALSKETVYYQAAANLMINKLLPILEEKGISLANCPISIQHLAAFIELIQNGKVSQSIAYQKLFPALFENDYTDPETLAQELNLIQSADEDYLKNIIADAIAKHPDKVKAYQKGKKNLLGLFMGEVMRNSKGKADPKATNVLLMKMLKEAD